MLHLIRTAAKTNVKIKQTKPKRKTMEYTEDMLPAIVRAAIEKYPERVAEYRRGKTGLVGLFMGEVMKVTKGKADPKTANDMILSELRF